MILGPSESYYGAAQTGVKLSVGVSMRNYTLVFFALICLVSSRVFADEMIQRRVAEALKFTVRIVVKNGDPFTSSVRQSHATGFIVQIKGGKALVFTNKHVIQKNPWEAQSLEIDVNALGFESGERVPAKLLLKSALIDFAVVEFDLAALSRECAKELKPAELPSKTQYERLSQPGSSVIAVGNPLESQSVVTHGLITNFHKIEWRGNYLQISAAINPGNSGGPLIEVDSGKVVGINTMMIRQAAAMGFAIPISEIQEEYDLLRKSEGYATQAFLPFVLAPIDKSQLEAQGFRGLLEARFPKARIFQSCDNLHIVINASENSPFMAQDILLTAEGQFVGGDPFSLRKIVQRSRKKNISMQVLRQGEVVTLDCPINVERFNNGPSTFDFVTFSGAFFTSGGGFDSLKVGGREGSVNLSGIFPGTLASQHLGQLATATLISVEYGGKAYPVETMSDFKACLREIPQEENNANIKLIFMAPLRAAFPGGMVSMQGTDRRRVIPVVIPVAYLMTDETISLPEILADFDFLGFERPWTRMGLLGLWAQCGSKVIAETSPKKKKRRTN